MGPITFAILATVIVLAALAVVLHPDPVYCALALVTVMCLLAVFFAGLDAHLVAALQVIVYAGAIMVLFLFVIMLLGRPEPGVPWVGRPLLLVSTGLAATGLAAGVMSLAGRAPLPPAETTTGEGFGTTTRLGTELFTTYLLPFEMTSVLLLIAIVGAVIMARGRL